MNLMYSQELEAQVLGFIVNNPESYIEFSSLLDTDDFFHEVNETLFSILRNSIEQAESIDKTILKNKISRLGINFKDSININDYIDSLAAKRATLQIIRQSIIELKKLSARRLYSQMGEKIIRKMKENGDYSFEEIVSFVDKTLYDNLDKFMTQDDTIDLFDGLYELIEERGNNPVEEIGFKSPYPEFNNLYGGFKKGDVYVFCARPKSGKTTFLNSTAFKMTNLMSEKIPCLIIDTEMGQEQAIDVKVRLMSSITGINPWYFTTGNWRKNEEMIKIVRDSRLKEKLKNYSLHYKYVTNTSIDNLVNTIKKWYYTKVGRGNPCVVVYDYIKLSGEKSTDSNKEYQIIGEKVNRLKELMGKEVNGPLLTAIQLNRSGDNRKGNQSDDSTAIAASDRVLWFASYVGIFRKKTAEESVEEDGFGSHKLITLATRFQGKNGTGANEFVKTPDGSLTYNFLNFEINNFDVNEIGSAEQMFKDQGRAHVEFTTRKKEEDDSIFD